MSATARCFPGRLAMRDECPEHLKQRPPRRWAWIVCRALIKGAAGFILGFLPFFVAWCFTERSSDAAPIFWYLACVLGLGGGLAGIGWEVVAVFGKGKPAHPSLLEEGAEMALEQLTAPLLPDFTFGIGKMLFWLARKDFSAQESGRGRRAVLGAIILGIVAFFVFMLLLSVRATGNSFAANLGISALAGVVGALVGAVLGALSDSM